jgi:transposase
VPTFIGIDYHKAYSVYCVLDAQGSNLERGRIDHARPEDFRALVRRWPGCHLVFEASMNWHWLFEILEREVPSERIVLANPFKTRIIAEAQIKTDKVDARILADLLRGKRAYCRSGDPADQGGAPPALFFRPPAHQNNTGWSLSRTL